MRTRKKICTWIFLFQSDYTGVLYQNPKVLTGPPWGKFFIADNLQTRFSKGGTLTNPIFGCLQIKKWMWSLEWYRFEVTKNGIDCQNWMSRCPALGIFSPKLPNFDIFDMTSFPSRSNFFTLLQLQVEFFLCTFRLYMPFLPFS